MAQTPWLGVALAVPLLPACGARQTREVVGRAPGAGNLVAAGWPDVSRTAADAMIAKYGQPDEVTETMLVWHDAGPWKQTILSRDPVPHDFPKPHMDVLEQVIDYRVPPDRFDDLAAYDGSVIVERTKGQMSARCDKEEMNFLALNLAHDVVSGRRTAQEARRFYAETAMAFMNGQRPPYTQGLQFTVPSGGTGDRDQPLMP